MMLHIFSEPFEIKSIELKVPEFKEDAIKFAENLKLEIFDKVIKLTDISEAISPLQINQIMLLKFIN